MEDTKLVEDPIRMYIVVNTSFNMSIGKTAAQVGHAVGLLMQQYHKIDKLLTYLQCDMSDSDYLKLQKTADMFEQWMNADYGKIVLQADAKEWAKLKTDLEPSSFVLVVDNGLTEIKSGSETCIGLIPMHKSNVPKCVKRLQLLK